MKNNVTPEEIRERYETIKPYINRTPIIHAVKLSELSGNEVFVKLENLQKAGSFKIRGALSKILALSENERKKGIIAASAGNHSQGVGYAGQMLGIPTTIVMPETAPIAKINATKKYGVDLVLHGNFFDDAQAKATEIAKEKGLVLVHAFNDIDIVKGQGSIGVEILEDIKDADYVLVPVGGGGVMAGISAYIKQVNPNCKLIAVESENVPSYYESRKTGKPFLVNAKPSIADGIAVKQTGEVTFEILNKYVDDVVLVSEEEIAQTILFLFENCKILAEGAGASTSAAILFNKLNVKNKKIVCVLTGGNIDVTSFLNITNQALFATGRRVVLRIGAPLGKNTLSKVTDIIYKNGIQIYRISESQFENSLKINREILKVVLEINAPIELENLKKDLKDQGFEIVQ
ncbi:threonine ammonia-lyase [Williamsoniiplasma luminosum]|uniref:threonine ammonia-lyase n=1 Tax=Williamsoniiplasma luminosum TaxID=214888 RepID=A0A2S0NKL7_9MOLU|nr:threonine ammonia-lyase [Williamsoniiplasma luminosum]AVP49560.1 MAG: threonine ammonia-lyase [Williamsoniiplasma luminosum]